MILHTSQGVTETARNLDAKRLPAANALPVGMSAISKPVDTVLFAGRTAGDEAANARKQMDRVAKNELVFEDNFYGFMPLNKISNTRIELPLYAQIKADTYADLLAYALRPKTMDKAVEGELRRELERPSAVMKDLMRQFNVTVDNLKEPLLDADKIDADNDVPPDVLTRMGKLGLFALKIPKEHGGLGMSQMEYSAMLNRFAEITGSPTLVSILSAHSTIGSSPLQLFGTDEQRAKYFPQIAKGNFLVAFGLTEPRAGTDLQGLETTAAEQPDGSWKLNGQKLFITNTINAGLAYFVTGHTLNKEGVDIGPTTFIVELPFKVNESREEKERKIVALSKQGMSILPISGDSGARLMVINGSNQAHIWFKDFTVPADHILGVKGDGLMVPLQGLTKGRAGFGPMLTQSSRWFATQSTAHLVDRLVTDMSRKLNKGKLKTEKPLQPLPGLRVKKKQSLGEMEYPRTLLGDMLTRAAMTQAVSEIVAGLIDANPDMGAAGLSAAVKVISSCENWQNAQKAMELHGGSGLFRGAPNRMERNFRDAVIPLTVEGVTAAMQQFMVAMGALPVSRSLTNFGKAEVVRRLKGWPGNVKEDLKLVGQGQFRDAWRHYKDTSLLTVPQYARMLKAQGKWLVSQVNFESGLLPAKEAFWIQTHIREMALRFNWMGLRRGDGIILHQNDVIRTANVLMDIFRVTTANVKLAKKGFGLPLMERKALETGILEAKMRVDQEMKYIRMAGHPVEKRKAELGRMMLDADKTRRDAGERKNTQDEYIHFLEEKNRAYQRRLAAKFSTSS